MPKLDQPERFYVISGEKQDEPDVPPREWAEVIDDASDAVVGVFGGPGAAERARVYADRRLADLES